MRRLHIVQGGTDNGDKAWLEKSAKAKMVAKGWTVPKSVEIGDDVVVYIRGIGFFATARVVANPEPHDAKAGRYAAGIGSIKLIRPAISIETIRREIPKLTWAIYPRSITTPTEVVAGQVSDLIKARRKTGLPKLDDKSLALASLDELRAVALLNAKSKVAGVSSKTIHRARSHAIRKYVLTRANGFCEGCGTEAPFLKPDGSPYLEPHHTSRLADDGPDHPAKVIGLCPACHRRAHYSWDAKKFKDGLIAKLKKLEKK